MEKFLITGGKKLVGEVTVSGSKNMALKAMVAACLTEEKVVLQNVPIISDVLVMIDVIKELGGTVTLEDHTLTIQMKKFLKTEVSLDKAAQIRTASMFIAPLLARAKQAIIPNPGGCRIGARPIDRTIEGIKNLGVNIDYISDDGYFHAKVTRDKLKGTTYRFDKNSHTGTETLILAAVLASGKTLIENAAQEPEVDQLIDMLNQMGAVVKRVSDRTVEISGVEKLSGITFRIHPDRNEVVTLAIAGIITEGNIFVKEAIRKDILEFLHKLEEVGGGFEEKSDGIRFFYKGELRATDVTTSPYPGFMTDWQAPWAVLMTKAKGVATLHETVYEDRFGYVTELKKMGAKIEYFQPFVENPDSFYNFNLDDDKKGNSHAIKIHGPTTLHNAVVKVSDLRAGATLVLGALAAKGTSTVFGIELLDRGYENFETRLEGLGADIKREKNE